MYSNQTDRRARAFHIMDPKGVLEMLIVFLEERGLENLVHPVLDDSQGDGERITPFLGTWKGRSITKRSGVYGSTLSEADTVAVLDINDQGQVVQVHDIQQHSSSLLLMSLTIRGFDVQSGYFLDI